MYTFETKLRVRYAETDQMAYVYYGNYASYFEVARVDMLRSIGLSYKAMEESGIMMPVLEMKSKYIKPAYYDDLLTIKVIIKEIPQTRIVNMESMRPCNCPEILLSKIKENFTN